ncbi:MAG: flagellar biosynthesis anti-sigma factor FlgM [Sedimentisphaerales bacterium]|nr:flagellar biosynthesis anti-sigma factor FlgM [Sedimentisphaerales bacterium]
MNNIYGVNGFGAPPPLRSQNSMTSGPAQSRPSIAKGNTDPVEISDYAYFLNKIASLPEIRSEKVEQVRQAIAQGQYDTPEKLSIALDRLLEENGQE